MKIALKIGMKISLHTIVMKIGTNMGVIISLDTIVMKIGANISMKNLLNPIGRFLFVHMY